jgi:hypothetical protein
MKLGSSSSDGLITSKKRANSLLVLFGRALALVDPGSRARGLSSVFI